MISQQFMTVLEKDEAWFLASCPELDITSQGVTLEEAQGNLAEAIELFFEVASSVEIQERMHH